MTEGWITIQNSRKYHYVIDKMTVCKKFMYLGSDIQGDWTGNFTDDDCKACVTFLQNRDKKKSKSAEDVETWENPQGEICPKCNKNKLYKNQARNSLSRRDNTTYICPDCGEKEACEDMR